MSYNRNASQNSTSRLLDELFNIPGKSLEARLKNTKADISKRNALSSEILSELFTLRHSLKEQIWRMRYVFESGQGSIRKWEKISQLITIHKEINNEMISCFKDLSYLREKLIQIEEELELNKRKSSLIKNEGD